MNFAWPKEAVLVSLLSLWTQHSNTYVILHQKLMHENIRKKCVSIPWTSSAEWDEKVPNLYTQFFGTMVIQRTCNHIHRLAILTAPSCEFLKWNQRLNWFTIYDLPTTQRVCRIYMSYEFGRPTILHLKCAETTLWCLYIANTLLISPCCCKNWLLHSDWPSFQVYGLRNLLRTMGPFCVTYRYIFCENWKRELQDW